METKRPSKPGTATDEPVPPVHFKSRAEAEAYKAGIAEGLRRARGGLAPPPALGFDPVPLRFRSDGWTPERQVGFIRALAECGCVAEACRRVGKSPESAYELARRPDAQSFRIAWDIAIDNAVRRLSDNVFARAMNGVEVPHYYKGELIGTHRRYDERLAMFILRTRDKERGRCAEAAEPVHTRESRALDLADMLAAVRDDAEQEARGLPRRVTPELGVRYSADNDDGRDTVVPARDPSAVYAFAAGAEPGDQEDELDQAGFQNACGDGGGDDGDGGGDRGDDCGRAAGAQGAEPPPSPPDVPRTSSTSAPDPLYPRKQDSSPAPPPAPDPGDVPPESPFRGNHGPKSEAGGAGEAP